MDIGFLQNIIINNLISILKFYNIENPKKAAEFLNINYSTYRSWMSFERQLAIKTLDEICDTLKIPTYVLFVPDLNDELLNEVIGTVTKNNSIEILQESFKTIYKKTNKNNWNEIVSTYSGLLSEDTLKSYQRPKNYIVPPVTTLEEMCSYLGIPAYKLLRGDI